MLPWFSSRFSLRTLLIATTLVAVGLGVIAARSRLALVAAGTLFALLLLAGTSKLHAADHAQRLAELDNLVADGNWDIALTQARQLREELPPNLRLTSWELDFRGEVVRAVFGDSHLYYQLSTNSEQNAPGRQQALPSVNPNATDSRWRHFVVCVNLDNGQIRWSRAIEGLVHLAVEPTTDALYLWREKLLRLDAASGEVTLRRDLPDRGRGIQGLKLGRTVVILHSRGAEKIDLRGKLALYDPERDVKWHGDLSDIYLLSPDERHRLIPRDNESWISIDPVNQRGQWASRELTLEYPPLWHGDSIITYSGNEWKRGTVSSFDAHTGERRWDVHLGWGAYSVRRHQLRGGGYPDDDWRPLVAVKGYILALDGSGRIVFIEPKNGATRATVLLAPHQLREPRLVGDNLVVCSFNWARSFPLQYLIEPASCPEAACLLHEARCLHETDHQDALATIDTLVERAPNHREAWALRADICSSLNLRDEESFSRYRALALADRDQVSALRDGWGLVRLVDLGGKPAWDLQTFDQRVFSGTQAGELWSVRLDSLEAGLEKRVDHEITNLKLRSELQAAVSGSRTPKSIQLDSPQPTLTEGIPQEWWIEGGRDRIGRAVAYAGRQFRPIRGGGVRILAGTQMSDLPGQLKNVGVWEIHLSPHGPLGYGEGGVFKLDDDLRPESVLYRPVVGRATPQIASVLFLRRNAGTIGVVVASDQASALQVVSPEGRLLSEAPLGLISGRNSEDQLIAVENGFLFSDRQLVWTGTARDQSWRFGPSLDRTSTPRWGDRWRYFGDPTMEAGYIFVTSLDGHLFIFDAREVSSTAHYAVDK